MTFKFLTRFRKRSTVESPTVKVGDLLDRAQVLQREAKWESASALYFSILEIDPNFLESLIAVAAAALQNGELHLAISLYDKLIGHAPDRAELYYKRGNAQNALGRRELAIADYDQAIALRPTFATAHCNRGAVLAGLSRWEEALASYDQALALNDRDHLAYFNRGAVLKDLKQFEAALRSYEAALALREDYFEAQVNRGTLLLQMRRPAAALASYELAIAQDRAFPEAHHGRGLALFELGCLKEALQSYEAAIALKRDYAEAYVNSANVLVRLGEYEAAIANYSKALELQPNFAKAHLGRGTSLAAMKQFEAAIASYDQAFESSDNPNYVVGLRRHAKMHLCDWSELEKELALLGQALGNRELISSPLPILALYDSARLHRLAAEIWVREECPFNDSLGAPAPYPRAEKIRIGYFSADFRQHPVSFLTAELFETHDRSRFEIVAFAFGPKDAMTERLSRAFDQFVDVYDCTDAEIALRARELKIDIAVDLGGFTEHARSKVFALRAAPVQMSYIGYLSTMGAPYMDYLLADPVIIPPGLQEHYSEKIVYLTSYQVNDTRRRISERVFVREELGLPSAGFVFCCFNANYKIMPHIFSAWMRILKRVDGASLFLYVDNDAAERNLRNNAAEAGVDPRRLAFGKRLPVEDYRARYRAMDLFLDTHPYNAGTTASDALWAGLPVITCQGESFPARVAASLLTAVGLPQLIVSTLEDYVELAVRLASHPDELRRIRDNLSQNRATARLFDVVRFTRELESAYMKMYELSQTQSPAAHIFP